MIFIMDDLNYIFSCTIDDLPSNGTEEFEKVSPFERNNVVECGAIAGVLISIILNRVVNIECHKPTINSSNIQIGRIFNKKNSCRAIALTILLLILPVVIALLILALMYKKLCFLLIRSKDHRFAGFLDSFDVFWSLEDDTSKSVINVLGVIESDSAEILVASIKEKLLNIFPNENTCKIFYRRNEDYGFYYWNRHNSIDIDEYVQIIELPDINEDITVADMENLMSIVSDQSLPYNDKGLFKVLITKQKVRDSDSVKDAYGIIFRIHHSVGDGVALIEFLCKTLADKSDKCPVNMFSMPDTTNVQINSNSAGNLLSMMKILCEIPICFVDGILRTPDKNILHGHTLLGKKVFKWTESDENLLTMVKDIKDNVDNLNFSDVLATSLATGLENFFAQKLQNVPEVAVVIPVRFPKTSNFVDSDIKLENDFSVTILDLPTHRYINIRQIKESCNQIRRSADPLTNYYFLKLVSSVLPVAILHPLLNSSQATMVFSNLPGPERLSICGGNALKSLVFFVPHKSTTGLGITALCYGGVLRFAAMADAALVSSPEELSVILDAMVESIKSLHKQHVK